MATCNVVIDNRSQAVCIPEKACLPEEMRAEGNERISAPVTQSWDCFFLDGPRVSDDFLPERATQPQRDGETL